MIINARSLVYFLLILIFFSCSKKADVTETPIPDPTMTATINGEKWQAANPVFYWNRKAYTLELQGKTATGASIYLRMIGTPPRKCEFNDYGNATVVVQKGDTLLQYLSTDGYIEVTDTVNGLFKGTFEIIAQRVDLPTETISITNGQFNTVGFTETEPTVIPATAKMSAVVGGDSWNGVQNIMALYSSTYDLTTITATAENGSIIVVGIPSKITKVQSYPFNSRTYAIYYPDQEVKNNYTSTDGYLKVEQMAGGRISGVFSFNALQIQKPNGQTIAVSQGIFENLQLKNE